MRKRMKRKRIVFGEPPYVRADLDLRGRGTSNEHRARIGLKHPRQHPNHGAFSGPVGPKQTDHAVLGQPERNPAQGDLGPKGFVNFGNRSRIHTLILRARLIPGSVHSENACQATQANLPSASPRLNAFQMSFGNFCLNILR